MLRILDPNKLDRVSMSAIIFHWTAGGHRANAVDRRSYHLLVEGDGAIEYGVPIRLNSGGLKSGYAAHTLNANSNRIGMSMCGMMGAQESPFNPGSQPLTRVQWDRSVIANADLCEFYRIGVARNTVLSHAEVQSTLGIAQRQKWDIARLPFDLAVRGARAIGDRFRDEVMAALRGNGPAVPVIQPEPVPALADGAVGVTTANGLNFRRGPGTHHEATGSLPAGTHFTLLSVDGDWFNIRTPAGHVGWVHGGYVKLIDVAPVSVTNPDPVRGTISGIRSLLDNLEDDLPDDRERLARILNEAHARLTSI